MTVLSAEPALPTRPDPLGARYRRVSAGPEADLIAKFLAHPPILVPPGCRLTVFREPALESGFPDLVAVIWKPCVTRTWPTTRTALTIADFRMMQHLLRSGGMALTSLMDVFGRDGLRSLARLEANAMVRSQGSWRAARALGGIFAVREIVAVEAKMTAWSSALEQASLNRWFASKSYVLVPQLPKDPSVLETARFRGIGIWVMQNDRARRELQAASAKQPVSYASWLFNDWVWRDALRKEDL